MNTDLLALTEMATSLRSSIPLIALAPSANTAPASSNSSNNNKRKKPSSSSSSSVPVPPTSVQRLDILQLSAQAHLSDTTIQPSMQRHWLKIQPNPPKFPFVDVFFNLQVFLVDKKDNMRSGLQVPLHLDLLYDGGGFLPVPDQKILELEGDLPMMDPSGVIGLNVRIKQVSMQHENRPFRIKVSSSGDAAQYGVIEPALSPPMTVIRHRLKILEQPSSVWYKDEGGRDKCMSMVVALVDEHDNAVTGREVMIKASLAYEGDVEVKNQSILKLINETLPRIGRDGKCVLRCRVDEVSKNHQKQAFCIKASADVSHSPANFDISSDLSRPVTVRSKRNRQRRSDVASSLRSESQHSKAEVKIESAPFNNSVTPVAAPPVLRPEPKSDLYNTKELNALSSTGGTVGTAIHGVISWAQFVVKELLNIEWQLVGYEMNERENTVNYHKPLYRCPGCWSYRDGAKNPTHTQNCMLFRIVYAYDADVSKLLQTLVKHANVTSSAQKGLLVRLPSVLPGTGSELGPPPPVDPLALPDFAPPAFDGDQLPLFRTESTDQTAMQFTTSASDEAFVPSFASSSAFTHSALDAVASDYLDVMDFEEQQVEYVHIVSSPFGFPAFSRSRELLGFYFIDGNNLVFINLVGKDLGGRDFIGALLEAESSKPGTVISKSSCVTLERLKETVMITIYQNQAGSFAG